jgi:hypothetical protein
VAATPRTDLVEEAVRLTDAAGAAGLALRITGGVAVAMSCPSAATAPLRRDYADIDAVGRGRERGELVSLLAGAGYEADRGYNVLQGANRLLFHDPAHGRQLDVFLDEVEMCHRIDLRERIDCGRRTLTPADLLLLKLQIVETNRKDLADVAALLLDHDFTGDDAGIDLSHLTRLGAGDWGLWRTTTMIARRVEAFAAAELDPARAEHVHRQVRRFLEAMETVPKTRRWRLRARVGDRKRWYEVPEEVR